MQVLFDLRPPHLVQAQGQKVDLTRVLIIVLFVGFVVVSIFNIANMMVKLRGLNTELDEGRLESSSIGNRISGLDTKIAEFRAARDKIKAYLEFTRQDLPTVEFLSGLEGAITAGLKVSNIDIRPGSVTMRGSGVSDQDVMDFVNALDGMKYMITKVDPPTMTKSTLNNALITDFALSCNIKSVTEIGEALPELLNIRTTPAIETAPEATQEQTPDNEEGQGQ
ncbi:MAG: PilN domain-containing protein [Synergistaceae bacterium]|jgi:hypothetical protein|nr:PilN domain-containing protein [Synergistaceae bacterium]